jgi:hypothetical protein
MTTEHDIRDSGMTTEDELREPTSPTGDGLGEPGARNVAGGDPQGDGADTGRMRGVDDTEPPADNTEPQANGAVAHAEGTVAGAGGGTGSSAAAGGGAQSPSLIAPDRASGFQKRWDELKGDFVDDPRHTVQQVDGLVGDVLDELEQVFRRQRGDLEAGLSDEGSSTEDLRVAFGRYREFFDRLLKF